MTNENLPTCPECSSINQERTTAEALHEIADMPGEDSYGFYVRV